MNINRFTLRAAVYLMLIRNQEILLLRRYQTGWMDGWYSLIAGHLDGNESITQAVIREAREEGGIVVRHEDLRPAHVLHKMSDNNREYTDFFYVTEHWEGEILNAEPDKCDDLSWFPLDKLPEKTLPFVQHVIDRYEKGIPFSEYGW